MKAFCLLFFLFPLSHSFPHCHLYTCKGDIITTRKFRSFIPSLVKLFALQVLLDEAAAVQSPDQDDSPNTQSSIAKTELTMNRSKQIWTQEKDQLLLEVARNTSDNIYGRWAYVGKLYFPEYDRLQLSNRYHFLQRKLQQQQQPQKAMQKQANNKSETVTVTTKIPSTTVSNDISSSNSSSSKWTTEQLQLLKITVESMHRPFPWQKIQAELFPNRSLAALRHKYNFLQRQAGEKRLENFSVWSAEEMAILQYIEAHLPQEHGMYSKFFEEAQRRNLLFAKRYWTYLSFRVKMQSLRSADAGPAAAAAVVYPAIDPSKQREVDIILQNIQQQAPRRSWRWSSEEDDIIRREVNQALSQGQTIRFGQIAQLLETNKTSYEVKLRWRQSLSPHILNGDWTDEEDELLLQAVSELDQGNFTVIEEQQAQQTIDRKLYSRISTKTIELTKKEVEEEEVDVNIRQVDYAKVQRSKWRVIAELYFQNRRTSQQCSFRYNAIDPHRVTLKKGDWSNQDLQQLACLATSMLQYQAGKLKLSTMSATIKANLTAQQLTPAKERQMLYDLQRGMIWQAMALPLQRSNAECRRKWYLELDSQTARGDWTAEEFLLLFQGIYTHGEDFAKIKRDFLPNRYESIYGRWQKLAVKAEHIFLAQHLNCSAREMKQRDPNYDFISYFRSLSPAIVNRAFLVQMAESAVRFKIYNPYEETTTKRGAKRPISAAII